MTKNQLTDANFRTLRNTAEAIRRDIVWLKLSLTHARHLLDALEHASGEDDLAPVTDIVHDTIDALTGAMMPAQQPTEHAVSIARVHLGIINEDMADRVGQCLGFIQSARDAA